MKFLELVIFLGEKEVKREEKLIWNRIVRGRRKSKIEELGKVYWEK